MKRKVEKPRKKKIEFYFYFLKYVLFFLFCHYFFLSVSFSCLLIYFLMFCSSFSVSYFILFSLLVLFFFSLFLFHVHFSFFYDLFFLFFLISLLVFLKFYFFFKFLSFVFVLMCRICNHTTCEKISHLCNSHIDDNVKCKLIIFFVSISIVGSWEQLKEQMKPLKHPNSFKGFKLG